MRNTNGKTPVMSKDSRRVFYFNAGFLQQKRVRRILSLKGYDLKLGYPNNEDLIAVWGRSPYAHRGEQVAQKAGAGLIRIEDAFLRSIHPGRSGEAPLGLVIDQCGIHFDASHPSDLENLLATHPLDDSALMARARAAIERIKDANLSKYNSFPIDTPCPDPGYVLVIDQTREDASVLYGGADANTFREMLYYAQEDNPGARILIKTHPETQAGHRSGYFSDTDETDRIHLFSNPISPWLLLEGAIAVYTVSSQLGFESIFAGHKPKVFGRPFYAGWSLTEDRHPLSFPRRGRRLTRAQMFAAAMILYPTWYDPYRDSLCELEGAISTLEAQVRCWREDHLGWEAHGMRLWKRKPLQAFFGQHSPIHFGSGQLAKTSRPQMAWASKVDQAPNKAVLVEDGFLRSKGLGANLIPPLSLVCDTLGIYYDPTRESRLENLITKRGTLRPDQHRRAEDLIRQIRINGLSKYNLGGSDLPDIPKGRRILVPGQVEDDASILLGAGVIQTNLALLSYTRAQNPDAVIIYKPHPDIEAGLRQGAISKDDLSKLVNVTASHVDLAALLELADEVWTMTSLLGFEALIHDVKVTTTGAPFYAGWGLTSDLGIIPPRRTARPSIEGLIHAALIDYPRYLDPITGLPCPVEVIVDRLIKGTLPHARMGNRALAKLQGAFATYSAIWRK